MTTKIVHLLDSKVCWWRLQKYSPGFNSDLEVFRRWPRQGCISHIVGLSLVSCSNGLFNGCSQCSAVDHPKVICRQFFTFRSTLDPEFFECHMVRSSWYKDFCSRSVTVACQALGALVGCLFVASVEANYGVKNGSIWRTLKNEITRFRNNGGRECGSSSWISSLLSIRLPSFCPVSDHRTTSCWSSYRPSLRSSTSLCAANCSQKDQSKKAPVKTIGIQGSISCFLHISASFGAAMGAILSLEFMLGGEDTWGFLLLLPSAIGLSFNRLFLNFPSAVIEMMAAYWMPDTPNHLLQRGSYSEAIKSIVFYYDVTRTFNEDEDYVLHYYDAVTELPPQSPFWTVVRRPESLKGILLGCVVSATQVFSGSMATISYSSSMFSAVSFMDILVPFLPAIGSIISIVLTIPALQLVYSNLIFSPSSGRISRSSSNSVEYSADLYCCRYFSSGLLTALTRKLVGIVGIRNCVPSLWNRLQYGDW